MIISRIFSGLGNQLFQYTIGRQIALKQNTNLKLDTFFYSSQNLRSNKLQHFNIEASIASTKEVSDFLKPYTSSDIKYKIFRKFSKYIPRTQRRLFKEQQDWVFDDQLFKISPDTYIEGYWQNYRYFDNIDPSIFTELTLKTDINPSTLITKEQIKTDEKSVSVHIRRGDYVTDIQANALMGTLPLAYYQQAMRIMGNKVSNANFYFFSDDLNWVRNNFKGENIHYIDGGADYIDLDLMRTCRHNIIANSSFSWWGAFLNRNSSKVVIAPQQWVVPVEINNRIEIAFPEWIKI